MAAQIDFNFDPHFKLAASDVATLLAMQNFCIDNLKAILETIISNKKSQDQLKDNNDLMNYMIMVSEVMEEFQLRINQNFYLNKELEANELLQVQVAEGEERLNELNRLFAEVNAIQLAAQKIRELEFTTKNAQLEKELKVLNEQLRQAIFNVVTIKAKLSETNMRIEKTFDTIINNISNSILPIEFEVEGKTLRITNDEAKLAIKRELQEDFDNGTFTVENARPKIKNAFVKLGMEKLTEENVEHSPQEIAKVDKMAETKTNEVMELLRREENANTLNDIIAVREEQKSQLSTAEEQVETLKEEVQKKEEEIVDLRHSYSDVVPTVIPETSEAAVDYFQSNDDKSFDDVSEEELDDLDPFAQMIDDVEQADINDQNPNRPDDDELPPPEGDPDNNDYPAQSPPSYNEASAFAQQPEPSVPPQEEANYPAPSVLPLDEAPIPNEPSPAYIPRSQPVQPSAVSVEPISNVEAKIAEPLLNNKGELKAADIPLPQASKEIKSTGGIYGRLKVGADTVRKQLNDKNVEAVVSQGNKNQQPAKQSNINEQNHQNEPVSPEIKGPGRRR